MKDATAGAGNDDPAFFLNASLSSHALSVDHFYVDCGVLWYRQKREINRQKKFPHKAEVPKNPA